AVRKYAEKLGGPHFILSAFHGCRKPDYEACAYERQLAKCDPAEKRMFAGAVRSSLRTSTKPGDRIIVLAGKDYWRGWIGDLREEGRQVEVPLAGMGIGEQKRWLAMQCGGGER